MTSTNPFAFVVLKSAVGLAKRTLKCDLRVTYDAHRCELCSVPCTPVSMLKNLPCKRSITELKGVARPYKLQVELHDSGSVKQREGLLVKEVLTEDAQHIAMHPKT